MRKGRRSRQHIPLSVRISRFMIGRTGPDALGRFIYFLFLIALIVGVFVHHYSVWIVEGVLLFLYFFRFLSRNGARRRRENECFLAVRRRIFGFFGDLALRFMMRKTHVLRRCPVCKNRLRLPRRRGEHGVNCPVCRAHFKVKIR